MVIAQFFREVKQTLGCIIRHWFLSAVMVALFTAFFTFYVTWFHQPLIARMYGHLFAIGTIFQQNSVRLGVLELLRLPSVGVEFLWFLLLLVLFMFGFYFIVGTVLVGVWKLSKAIVDKKQLDYWTYMRVLVPWFCMFIVFRILYLFVRVPLSVRKSEGIMNVLDIMVFIASFLFAYWALVSFRQYEHGQKHYVQKTLQLFWQMPYFRLFLSTIVHVLLVNALLALIGLVFIWAPKAVMMINISLVMLSFMWISVYFVHVISGFKQ